MNFAPETEEEIDKAMLLPEGVYDFEVVSAEEKVSSKGNPMIAIVIRVFANDGSTRMLNDWLMPAPALSKKKLARFCRSTGIEERYDAGNVTAADCQGLAGRVVIKRKNDPQYGDQARVDTYEPRGTVAKATAPAPVKDDRTAPVAPAASDCPF